MIKNYKQFVLNRNESSINENLKQAAAYLSLNKISTDDSGFQKIRRLLSDQADSKLAYLFTKFFYEDLKELSEEERIEELRNLLANLKRLRTSLDRLPMSVERYVSKAANDEELATYQDSGRTEPRSAWERLSDDLTALEGDIIVNKWRAKLLSWQKVWFDKLTPFQIEKVKGIATAFDQFGIEEDGVKDISSNKSLQDMFFIKVKNYKTLSDLLKGAEDYIKSANNAGFKKFMLAIEKVNKKYGEANGAEIVWSDGANLIIEVRTYVANKDLNGNTSHCIVRTIGAWELYNGLDKFSKQYYIYDFNLPPSDNHSVIGITILPKGVIRACHLKDDKNFITEIVSYLKAKNIDFGLLKPMTEEEVEKRKRSIEASKEIIKPNITLDVTKELIGNGADPNAGMGRPLENAVREDNLEKTEYLLEVGAMPSVNNPIKYAKNFDMIKLLVSYGCEITTEVFKSISNDLDAVEYILDQGIDPNFERGYFIRIAAKSGNLDVVKLLVERGSRIEERQYLSLKVCIDFGQTEILEYLLEELKKKDPVFKNRETLEKRILDLKNEWLEKSLQISKEKKQEIAAILDSQLQ